MIPILLKQLKAYANQQYRALMITNVSVQWAEKRKLGSIREDVVDSVVMSLLIPGICFGWGVNKCNCAACVSLVRCEADDACGGLYGACVDGYCDCEIGFRNNGLRSTSHAYSTFCSKRDCDANGDTKSCFGLPCNSGICICPPEMW
uniref:CC domain-containing protein n=1 Tax=Syphacia muris TaxID=451379 RepID=A0A0N5AB64_9BILA